jgi:succinylglutamic semialdehyde dehydrogenase
LSSIFSSIDPSTGTVIWQGHTASPAQCQDAVRRAKVAQRNWARTAFDARVKIAEAFAALVKENAEELARVISGETGKPLWESRTEASGIAGKVAVSIAAYHERTGQKIQDADFGQMVLRHRPHGVLAVLGPFNFPGHLPTGHIVPALLAGNAVIFKPSEHTPATGAMLCAFWQKAGLPDDVLILLQGAKETGQALLATDIDGLLFTGSAAAGLYFQRYFADRPGFMLALELGGNNPLIFWDGDIEAAASIIIQSAFVTAGQRCSCARRLILPDNESADHLVNSVRDIASRLRVGAWDADPQPYMGSLISDKAADEAMAAFAALDKRGGHVILAPQQPGPTRAFMTPAIIDMTGISAAGAALQDEEIFGPVLQIIRAGNFDDAISLANQTAYGLSASLITQDDALWDAFLMQSRAGVVNRNRPTNGAAANMPFGGTGASGNHRPGAYYAADYCAYPVASMEAQHATNLSATITPFLSE